MHTYFSSLDQLDSFGHMVKIIDQKLTCA